MNNFHEKIDEIKEKYDLNDLDEVRAIERAVQFAGILIALDGNWAINECYLNDDAPEHHLRCRSFIFNAVLNAGHRYCERVEWPINTKFEDYTDSQSHWDIVNAAEEIITLIESRIYSDKVDDDSRHKEYERVIYEFMPKVLNVSTTMNRQEAYELIYSDPFYDGPKLETLSDEELGALIEQDEELFTGGLVAWSHIDYDEVDKLKECYENMTGQSADREYLH